MHGTQYDARAEKLGALGEETDALLQFDNYATKLGALLEKSNDLCLYTSVVGTNAEDHVRSFVSGTPAAAAAGNTLTLRLRL